MPRLTPEHLSASLYAMLAPDYSTRVQASYAHARKTADLLDMWLAETAA